MQNERMERTDGLVLQVRPLKDTDLLVTIYTQDFGLLRLVQKRGRSYRSHRGGAASPLMQGEFIFQRGREDLHFLREFSIRSTFHLLRMDLAQLEAAGAMFRHVLSSQLPEKPAPRLYRLLISYLERLPQIRYPTALSASFALKVLRHDGLLALPSHCMSCRQIRPTWMFSRGEWFCSECIPSVSLSFSTEEMKWLTVLCHCLNFSELKDFAIPAAFPLKVTRLFGEMVFS